MATKMRDVTGQFPFRVYRIFQKPVNFIDFGGNSENLPGCLIPKTPKPLELLCENIKVE
jgi:hypothetical protein